MPRPSGKQRKQRNRRGLLADQLRDVFDDSRMSCADLARKAEVGRRTVERWALGDRGLSAESLGLMAEALGVRLTAPTTRAKRPGASAPAPPED